MNEVEFFKFLFKWRKENKYPNSYYWPNYLKFSNKIWDTIKTLNRLTAKDSHEYESSLFYEGNNVIASSPFRGTTTNVRSSHILKVDFKPDQQRRLYEKQVFIDGKIVLKELLKPENIPQKIETGFLFNIHTHPAHTNSLGMQGYGFFSDIDIFSLLNSKTFLIGLVTNEFWIAGKTNQVIKTIGENGKEMLNDVNQKSYENSINLDQAIKEKMKEWGLVFYRGGFGMTLKRVI